MSNVQTAPDGRIEKRGNGQMTQGAAPRRQLADYLGGKEFRAAIAEALPKHITADRMVRIAMTALRTTRDLAQCTPESFFACLIQAALLGLEPNTPNQHVYLIPRRIKGTLECTLITGYMGQIELAMRSGKVEKIWTRVVREGDEFQVKLGLSEDIQHIPATDSKREERPLTYVYAVAKLKDGGTVFEVLSKAQVESRRPQHWQSSPWASHPEAMWRKSAVRSLFKWIPKSAEMAVAEQLEERSELGKKQLFDGMVHEAVEHMGLSPIVDTEPDHDPQTGEVLQQEEPGAAG